MSEELLELAGEAVDLAAGLMRRPAVVVGKGDRDMATDVDVAIEDAVHEFLARRTPEIGFVGEEGGRRGDGERSWVLDPVDGTANFVRGIPLAGISLALVENGTATVGVIALPFLDERYRAATGLGAYGDDGRLRVSTTRDLRDAIVTLGDYAVGEGAAEKNAGRFAVTEALAARVQRLRMVGSAATDLAWVACGRTDAAVILSNKLWDTAAGVLIAREAGALVLDRAGNDHTASSAETIAVTPSLSRDLLDVIRV